MLLHEARTRRWLRVHRGCGEAVHFQGEQNFAANEAWGRAHAEWGTRWGSHFEAFHPTKASSSVLRKPQRQSIITHGFHSSRLFFLFQAFFLCWAALKTWGLKSLFYHCPSLDKSIFAISYKFVVFYPFSYTHSLTSLYLYLSIYQSMYLFI